LEYVYFVIPSNRVNRFKTETYGSDDDEPNDGPMSCVKIHYNVKCTVEKSVDWN